MKIKTEATPSDEKSGGHWYTSTGLSAHGATLREARKENLFPSVTTVLGIKSKPGLDAWKRNEAILSALTLPQNTGESAEDFAVRVAIDMDSTASRASSIGTSIHDWAENYCNKTPISPPTGYEQVCYKLQCWIDENLSDDGESEKSMVSAIGYAGRIDWIGTCKKTGLPMIVDFKTQNIKTGRKPTFYPEWCYQLTAYSNGEMPVKLVNVAISSNVENPVIAEKEWCAEEKANGWEIFKHCLKIWQLERGYTARLVDI